MRQTVEVEVCLDEFDDDALLAEIQRRGEHSKVKAIAGDVIGHLMARRDVRAGEAMRELLAAFVPPTVLAASEALRNGMHSQAICDLDRFIAPSPAVTAKTLPAKELATP